jgi:hypothetical protein
VSKARSLQENGEMKMSNYTFRSQPLSSLPKYHGFNAFGGQTGLDAAYEVIDKRTGMTIGSVARSGKEWLGYTLWRQAGSTKTHYKLSDWSATSRQGALVYLMSDIGLRD